MVAFLCTMRRRDEMQRTPYLWTPRGKRSENRHDNGSSREKLPESVIFTFLNPHARDDSLSMSHFDIGLWRRFEFDRLLRLSSDEKADCQRVRYLAVGTTSNEKLHLAR